MLWRKRFAANGVRCRRGGIGLRAEGRGEIGCFGSAGDQDIQGVVHGQSSPEFLVHQLWQPGSQDPPGSAPPPKPRATGSEVAIALATPSNSSRIT